MSTNNNRDTSLEHSSLRTAPSTCPDCDSTLVTTDAETYCPDCGYLSDTPQPDHETAASGTDTAHSLKSQQPGAACTERFHDHGLGSAIGSYSSDRSNTSVSDRARKRHAEAQLTTRKSRAKADGLAEVRRLCTAISGGDSLADRAHHIFRTSHDAELAIGFSITQLAAASVIAALRDREQPIPIEAVLKNTDADARQVHLLLQHVYGETTASPMPIDPVEHLPRLCIAVDAPQLVERIAYRITVAAQDASLHAGTTPESTPAAAIYVAAELTGAEITQATIADAANVTRRTIHNRYTDLLDAGAVANAIATASDE